MVTMDSTTDRRPWLTGARAALPLALAVALFGASFGVLAVRAGFDALQATLMSATTFAGSGQFAAISVLSAGGATLTAVAGAVLLNARYVAIGLTVAPALEGPWWKRLLQAQLITDESWAIGYRSNGRWDRRTIFGAGSLLFLAWVAGTAVGALGGRALEDPEVLGLDAAFPALFLALLVPQVGSARALQAAVTGGAIALLLAPLTPPGVPILCAALGCSVAWLRPPDDGSETKE